MRVVYSPRYRIDIGPHVFPTLKYRLVHDRLLATGIVAPSDISEPEPASWDELALVHTPEYLDKLRHGTLAPDEVAQLELPWSREMVEGFRVMVGGTIAAARIACWGRVALPVGTDLSNDPSGSSTYGQNGVKTPPDLVFSACCHVGGGLHHAFANHGEGFCPLNDVAVATRVLQAHGIERVAIVDLDVHHGNGTAFIFNPRGAPPPRHTHSHRGARAYSEQDVTDQNVFTFSMHQQHNYPMWKPRGSLDIGLADGTRDATYLAHLKGALPTVMASQPQCVFYLAGADPYEDDQLGGLRLTREGLRARDRLVIETVRTAGVPLVIVLAGGYARHVEDTVAIHVATIEEAKSVATKTRNHEKDTR